jgi:hypothetical protein
VLRITADVNGRPIGRLFIHNTGRHTGDTWAYDVATWDDATQDGTFGVQVEHLRSDPWTKLVYSVLRVLHKENK